MAIQRVWKKSLIAIAGAIGVIAVGHGWVAHANSDGGFRGHHHGGGRLARLCDGDMTEKLTRMSDRLTTELSLTTDQQAKLTAVTQTIQDSNPQSACADSASRAMATPVERLDQMTTRMETHLAVLQQVRQPVEDFYLSLSSDQQDQLNTLMDQRRSRRHQSRRQSRQQPQQQSQPQSPQQ